MSRGECVRILRMLILASNSPRRKQLLKLGGWSFRVSPTEIDETPLAGETPEGYVCRLAETKARTAGASAPEETVVVAADTAVVDRSPGLRTPPAAHGASFEILGKPANAEEAEMMLRRLRGRTHQVYTALAVLRVADGYMGRDLVCTAVTMRAYTDSEMIAYINSGDPYDKAGGYAIQNAVFHPVAQVEGCYANVVGLPLCRLTRALARAGQVSPEPAPYQCLYIPGSRCSLSHHLLETTPNAN